MAVSCAAAAPQTTIAKAVSRVHIFLYIFRSLKNQCLDAARCSHARCDEANDSVRDFPQQLGMFSIVTPVAEPHQNLERHSATLGGQILCNVDRASNWRWRSFWRCRSPLRWRPLLS